MRTALESVYFVNETTRKIKQTVTDKNMIWRLSLGKDMHYKYHASLNGCECRNIHNIQMKLTNR